MKIQDPLLNYEEFQDIAGCVVHALNSRTWEAEAGRSSSLGPAWATECVPGSVQRNTVVKSKNK